MKMDVQKAGQDGAAGKIDDIGVGGDLDLAPPANGLDPVAFHHNHGIGNRRLARPVNQRAVLENGSFGHQGNGGEKKRKKR